MSKRQTDFHTGTISHWAGILQLLFPDGIPKRAAWTDLNAIVNILNIIGAKDNSNHMFMPGGGGLDLERSRLSHEDGCIELECAGLVDIVKPVELSMHYFGPQATQWAYFRLETAGLQLSDVYEDISSVRDYEEVTELSPGHYVDRSAWENGFYGYDDDGRERKLPKDARPVSRYTHGAFVIFPKGSIYNLTSDTYDGRHNKMSATQFHEHISHAAKQIPDPVRVDREDEE